MTRRLAAFALLGLLALFLTGCQDDEDSRLVPSAEPAPPLTAARGAKTKVSGVVLAADGTSGWLALNSGRLVQVQGVELGAGERVSVSGRFVDATDYALLLAEAAEVEGQAKEASLQGVTVGHVGEDAFTVERLRFGPDGVPYDADLAAGLAIDYRAAEREELLSLAGTRDSARLHLALATGERPLLKRLELVD